MYDTLDLSVENGVATVCFNQPQRGNPIDGPLCNDICNLGIELSERPDVRAVLFTAEGEKAFSYGGDISAFLKDLDALPRLIKRWTADLHSGIARLQRMNAPIVAAVQGICAGGMAGFVAGADYVVAEPGTKFVAAYSGIGYCNDAGSSIMFTRRMGIARTRRYLLLNETIGADEALAIGLVDKIVPTGELQAEARKMAERLAAGPTLAYGEIRRLLTSVEDQPLEAQLELEAQGLARMAGTADAREGLMAFAEKRKPNFKGR